MSDQTCAICGGNHQTPNYYSGGYTSVPVQCLQYAVIAIGGLHNRIAALEAEAQTRKDDGK